MNHANLASLAVDLLPAHSSHQQSHQPLKQNCALASSTIRHRAASAIMTLGLIASAMTSLTPVYAQTTLTVNSTDDTGVFNQTTGTLRDVLNYMSINCYGAFSPFTVNFNIPSAGPHVIAPATPLPAITCADTTINGYSQPGASVNSLASGNNAVLNINLNRPMLSTAVDGLYVNASNVTIRGLVISNFSGSGIRISNQLNVQILGNFIGTNVTGNAAQGNGTGIRFSNSNQGPPPLLFNPSGGDNQKALAQVRAKANAASPNKIGGTSPADRNVISGNTNNGIYLDFTYNEIVNNHIGTDKTGAFAVANGGAGIVSNATNLLVDGNFISYNSGDGVRIAESFSTVSNNLMLGNGGIGVNVLGNECAPKNVFIRQNNIGLQGSLGIDLGNVFLTEGTRDVNGGTLQNGESCYQSNGTFPDNSANGKAPGHPIVNNMTYEWTGASVTTTINAQLNFAPLAAEIFTIDLFDNVSFLDTNNKGVGRKYVASTTTPATDAMGSATFQIANASVVYHPTMTSTAPTGLNSGTSEFSVQHVTPFAYSSTYTNFSIVAGGTQTQSFTLMNITDSVITVATPSTNLASFTVALGAGCNSVAVEATCNVNVTYAKNVVASETAVLTLVQGTTTYKWNLVGVATAAGAAPTISFALAPASILVNGTTVGTLTVSNPNVAPLTANAFTFNYLPGLVNAGTPNASSTCVGATPTATAGVGSSATTTGFTIPGSGACTFSVTITSATAALYAGNIAAGLIVTPSGSSNATPFSLNVGALGAPVITSGPPPSGVTGQAYSFTATATGTGPITWSIVSGGLPSGLTLNTATGVISGNPSAGTFTFTLRATNMAGQTNQATSISIITPIIPVISLSASSLDFGNQNTGTTSNPLTVTISNTGNGSFDITSITGIGDFAHIANCPATLAPQTSCTLNVTFSPLTAGAISGLISVNTTALAGSGSLSLSGNGILVPRAIIVVNPSVLTFGDQALGSASAPQIVFISNTGLVTLELRNIAFSQTAFTRVAPPAAENPNNVITCGGTVAPRTSCAIGVIFSPSVLGLNRETLTITHNATLSGIEGTSSISLSGNATQRREPLIRVSGGLTFTDQVLETASSPQTITVTNTGTIVLNVGAISITPTNANTIAADFSVTSNCGAVNPNANCTISVSFTPIGNTGGKAATVNIASNATNASAGVANLSGNALPIPRPVIRLSATSIGFGNVISGSVVSSQRVSITNVGILPLNIASIITSGNFNSTHTCTTQVAPNQSCNIDVTFSPGVLGSSTGSLTINSNATPAVNQVTLSGTGCRFLPAGQQRRFVTNCG
jgi:Putative Ig domain/Abnormal spindle-like microcephaly-assoc'd, ASPM-SPD-2-Hydin